MPDVLKLNHAHDKGNFIETNITLLFLNGNSTTVDNVNGDLFHIRCLPMGAALMPKSSTWPLLYLDHYHDYDTTIMQRWSTCECYSNKRCI